MHFFFICREKPGDDDWKKLDDLKRPLLLNFSQCKLLTGDYYPVITHTSDVLARDPGEENPAEFGFLIAFTAYLDLR